MESFIVCDERDEGDKIIRKEVFCNHDEGNKWFLYMLDRIFIPLTSADQPSGRYLGEEATWTNGMGRPILFTGTQTEVFQEAMRLIDEHKDTL
jgi:hypothetical protein